MDKLIEIPAYDQFGDPNTRVIERMDPGVFEKTAGVLPLEVKSYLEKLEPDPNFLYLLLVALGAADYWGPNVNGDAFFEKDLIGVQSKPESMKNPAPYTGSALQRHKTFLSAHVFKHHVNKDPLNSFGTVELPAYDDKMHRVLLIVKVDKRKAPDIAHDVANGKSVVWSMGTKVPYDICSICGHRSKTVAEYCDHLKLAMNNVVGMGQKVYAINTMPRFFDISRVLVPADKTAMTLMKVACASNGNKMCMSRYSAAYDGGAMAPASACCGSCGSSKIILPSAFIAERMKVAQKMAETKEGDITKQVPAHTADSDLSDDAANAKVQAAVNKVKNVANSESDLPKKTVDDLANKFPLHQILSSMASLGMVAKPSEFANMVVIKAKKKSPASDLLTNVDSEAVKTGAVELLAPHMSERSALNPWLSDRMEKTAGTKISKDLVDLPTWFVDKYDEYRTNLMNWDPQDSERALVKYSSQIPLAGAVGGDWASALFGMTKTAGLKTRAGLATAAGLAPYFAAAHYELKGKQGKALNKLQKLLVNNRGKAGLAAAIGTLMGTRSPLRL